MSRFESGGGLLTATEFTWRDGERTIHFRAGVIADSPEIIAGAGWDDYELLTTERAIGNASVALAEDAVAVHHVPPGPINEVAGRVIDDVSTPSLVALGGGRVIDAAKAIAAVRGGRVAALPTTLSGAEMTAIHRLPEGAEAPGGLIRPEIVLADPPVMTTLPEQRLRASAMNALAHGADSLSTPFANPVAELAALRGASLIARALDAERARRDPAALALGSILGAYAIDSARFALHHVVSQTLVRTLRLPHAETNATMLPLTMAALIPRAGPQMTALARALRCKRAALAARIEELGGGPRRLSELGAERDGIDEAVAAMLARPELALTPEPPDAGELRGLVEAAW
ncbi:MAG: iron-containing alcohol dehydrogenase [Solirubrobacterales bacterium]|nr:iron-containing alcohol dehydrogenase [Solirubrobacterales bacterium]